MDKLYDLGFCSAPVGGWIYVLELSRRGSRKLIATRLPEVVPAKVEGQPMDTGERYITLRQVPKAVRERALAHLFPTT